MPRRLTATKTGARNAMKNVSFEQMVVSWLMQDGWQVFTPILDHGHKTDLLISDGPNYHRIQVKTFDNTAKNQVVENRWEDSNIDVVIYFARNSNWGFVGPAFKEKKRRIDHPENHRFQRNKTEFLKAFHKV